MKNLSLSFGIMLFFLLLQYACKTPEKSDNTERETANTYKRLSPEFNSDSCFYYLKKQVDFGPRTPGSKAHEKCYLFLQAELKRHGFTCTTQEAPVKTFDGKSFALKNIIASIHPEASERILLLAHWDCRPFADEDIRDKDKPIDGADDAASGVAVCLEIARQLNAAGIKKGIDIFFTDLEDYGQPSGAVKAMEDTWCLGTQHWAKNPHVAGYKAKVGILLDMVGARGATFPREGTSVNYASAYVNSIWQTAYDLGYAGIFVDAETGQTTDDHLYVNKLTGIPCVDIVHVDPNTGTYGRHHHTHDDNLSLIDKNTLGVVGQTVLEFIWKN